MKLIPIFLLLCFNLSAQLSSADQIKYKEGQLGIGFLDTVKAILRVRELVATIDDVNYCNYHWVSGYRVINWAGDNIKFLSICREEFPDNVKVVAILKKPEDE